jgi:hypothetical protein
MASVLLEFRGQRALLDRGVYEPDLYFNPGGGRHEAHEAAEDEEEPVHALDLRIGKVDESINLYHSANVLSTSSSTLSSGSGLSSSRPPTQVEDWLPQPPRSFTPPRCLGAPSSVSPPMLHRRPSTYDERPPYREASARGHWTPPLQHLGGLRGGGHQDNWRKANKFIPAYSRSDTCRMVEAVTNSLRYNPYERPRDEAVRQLIKEEPMSPMMTQGNYHHHNHRNSLVMRPPEKSRISSFNSKSSFLHHVLHHKAMGCKQSPTASLIKTEVVVGGHHDHHPDHANDELDRRIEAASRIPSLLDYSPPASPPRSSAVAASAAPAPTSDDLLPHAAAMRRHFLLQFQQHQRNIVASRNIAEASMASNSVTSSSPPPLEPLSPEDFGGHHNIIELDHSPEAEGHSGKGRRGRPRKHAVKVSLPPLYVFIRNMLHNRAYNPKVVSWVSEDQGVFKVNSTSDFAKTWGLMKSNRNEEMTYEKMSRAMRYHYGSTKQGRKGHLAMVKEKRLVYRFGELAINWRSEEVAPLRCCMTHDLCRGSLCLWSKE